MFSKMKACFVGAVLCTAVASEVSATTITTWNSVLPTSTIFSNGTHTFNVSIGNELQVSSSLTGSSASIAKFVGFDGVTYDPSSQGAIESFDYSIDQRSLGGAHGWGFGFVQDNMYHLFNMFSQFRNSATPSNQSSWTTFSATEVSFDDVWFNPYPTSSAPQLDISETGSLIQVGLVIFSGNGGAPFRSDTSAYDNFSISFNTVAVSEPMGVSIMGLGIVCLGMMRRRQVNAQKLGDNLAPLQSKLRR